MAGLITDSPGFFRRRPKSSMSFQLKPQAFDCAGQSDGCECVPLSRATGRGGRSHRINNPATLLAVLDSNNLGFFPHLPGVTGRSFVAGLDTETLMCLVGFGIGQMAEFVDGVGRLGSNLIGELGDVGAGGGSVQWVYPNNLGRWYARRPALLFERFLGTQFDVGSNRPSAVRW